MYSYRFHRLETRYKNYEKHLLKYSALGVYFLKEKSLKELRYEVLQYPTMETATILSET